MTGTLAQLIEFGVVSGSLTCTLVRVTLPVLVAVTVNVSTSPTLTLPELSLSALLVNFLTTVSAGLGGTVGATGVFNEDLK